MSIIIYNTMAYNNGRKSIPSRKRNKAVYDDGLPFKVDSIECKQLTVANQPVVGGGITESSTTETITLQTPGASSLTVDIVLTQLGNVVTLLIPTQNLTIGGAPELITSAGNAIPAEYRYTVLGLRYSVPVREDGTWGVGRLTFNNTGQFTLSRADGTSFAASATVETPDIFVTWTKLNSI